MQRRCNTLLGLIEKDSEAAVQEEKTPTRVVSSVRGTATKWKKRGLGVEDVSVSEGASRKASRAASPDATARKTRSTMGGGPRKGKA